jgi:hypothetical protein
LFNAIAVVTAVLLTLVVALWVCGYGIFISNYGGWGRATRSGGIRIRFGTENRDGWMWTVYYWQLALLAFLVIVYCLRAAARLAKKPGFCASCGYDLRATPERCPECGAIPPSRA